MQQHRRITSLQEDMAKLGLTSLVPAAAAPIVRDTPRQPERRRPVQESRERLDGKAKKKLKEQAARRQKRRTFAKKMREHRMEVRAKCFEARIKRLAEKHGAKRPTCRIKAVSEAAVIKRASLMESYDIRKVAQGPVTREKLAEGFGRVASIASQLARNFSVIEQFMGEEESGLNLPVMHPDSAFGYDTNISFAGAANGWESGEVTDYDSDAGKPEVEDDETATDDEPAADDKKDDDTVAEDDDEHKDDDVTTEDDDKKDDELEDPMHEDDEPDVKKDDDVTEDDDPEDKKPDDVTTEDDEPDADDKDKQQERRRRRAARKESMDPIDFELHALRIEADEMLNQIAPGAQPGLNMGYVTDIMNDMASYLGGAMKLYAKVSQAMTNMQYVGQGTPAADNPPPPVVPTNPAVIGQAQPEGETAIDQGGTPNAPKSGDATDTAGGVKEPKAESKPGKK